MSTEADPDVGNARTTRLVVEGLVVVDRPIEIEGQKASVGASVGIAFGPDDGCTSDEAIYAADLALYDAKTRGRKTASIFNLRMHEEVQERRQRPDVAGD